MCVEFTGLHVGAISFTNRRFNVGGTFFRHAPDAITRVNKQEKDENKRNLQSILDFRHLLSTLSTSEAGDTIGEVEMKWKRLRRQVKGKGKMRRQKTAISKTRRAKT